jgi:4a-hydroxytetrahydrobiopterin dehydratase
MEEIAKRKCEACTPDAPPATPTEIEEYSESIPLWSISEVEGMQRLIRIFTFRNFAEAVTFTNRVAEIAEEVDHHPAILTEWGKVTVSWWTHKIGGLHVNDFIMAARTDLLYEEE